TPYTRKAHNDDEKCTGIVDTARIWVEPTARVILTPDADTLCNEQFANIQVVIPTISTNGVRYKFRVETPQGVDVDPIPSDDLSSGVPIIGSISNTTLDAQQVLFIITPYTRDNNDNEKCPGKIDTAIVWINPTPVISVSLPDILYDTLFCNDSPVDFSVDTENGFIIGDKVYDITAVIGPNITGVTEGSGFDNDGTGFTDILNNAHNSIVQTVTYTITPRFVNVASDIFDCVDGIDTSITVYVAATLQDNLTSDSLGAYIGGHDIRCFGETDAAITLDRWGGFGSFLPSGYQYNWEARTGIVAGQRNQEALGANTYPVAVSDVVGCIVRDTITLTEPELFRIRVDNIVEDPCEGGNKGAIETTPLGGVSGYDYTWDGPFGMTRYEPDIYNLAGGDWLLEAYDTNGCFHPDHVFIPIASGMLTSTVLSEFGSLEHKYNLACNNDSTGWIWVEYVLNGNGDPNDYEFKWAHEGDTVEAGYQDTLSNLEAGDYVLVVLDTVGCTDTVRTTLDEPSALEILSESFSEYGGSQIYNISCFGTNNGSITIEDNDADRLGRYHEYSWTGPGGPTGSPNDQNQADLVAGTYTVLISDLGPTWYCTLEDSFTLVQPPQISLAETLSDYNGFQITCADSASGWIKVDVAGGYYHPSEPYVYEWTRLPDIPLAEDADSASDLTAGQYQVRITDSLNCSRDWTFTLNEPPQLEVNWTPVDINGVNVSCFNDSDGAIESTIVTGGIESLPYTYYWTRTENPGWNSIQQQPSGLVADHYI
ncbi:MAG: SprB repeat-containing protein, partial [Bacteroidales bacterium]|nr:SprB repeat-containing protein [Bacteroidales bacterium]